MNEAATRSPSSATHSEGDALAIVEAWQARVRDAVARRKPLCIRGGGSKDFYGEAPQGDFLDTRACSGIVDYDPTELVITVRAGTLLREVESVMAQHGQMLAFEPPHFGSDVATIGGAVAAGLSGPRRPYAGAVRDLVLGVRIVDGQGADLRFGGRVMKNVAGFDVSRLLAGAMGTLGIMVEVSLKCLPQPRAEQTLVWEMTAAEALRHVNEWSVKPHPISATCHYRGRLHVRLSGAEPAVVAAARALGGTAMEEGRAFWRALRDHAMPPFDQPTELWRMSVRATAPPLDVMGEQVIEWGGALRWVVCASRPDVVELRRLAAAYGGHATLFRARERHVAVFQPLNETLMGIHRRLKATFDPAGILNRGRLYPDL